MTVATLLTLRDDFKRRLNADVKSLVRLYDQNDGGRGRPGDWMIPLRKSALVLVASNLEYFLESTVCCGFEHLVDRDVVARKYPEGFRLWRFRSQAHMRNLSVDHAKELVELSQKLYSDVRPLTREEIVVENIKDQFANPTPKNVNWLMRLVDIEDYCDIRSVTVGGNAMNITVGLGELAQRRNDVAHGGDQEVPTMEDVKRLSKFAQLLSTRFMRDVSSAIERCV
ncbi:hypothetical protein H9Q09_02915 [Aurantimonas sp. DM33-3]|uniref:HEPN domain-containing protein n=1 Tax=Aurantimonas sp. DM33-3 TaxID=2766955 RepID=UPI001651F6E8|nr:HEPN domain-containing protein [Aurantimonas sp. DM33-3]MBC6715137.1 hypothetical protein [Aurantimonas sp. DM33-3]